MFSSSRRHTRLQGDRSSDVCCSDPSRRRHTRLQGDWSSDVCSFYPSRRRHTRLQGDWSSDVCSSDLVRNSPVKKNDPLPLCFPNSLRITSPPSAYPCPVKTTANRLAVFGPRIIPPSRSSTSDRSDPWPPDFPFAAGCPSAWSGSSI